MQQVSKNTPKFSFIFTLQGKTYTIRFTYFKIPTKKPSFLSLKPRVLFPKENPKTFLLERDKGSKVGLHYSRNSMSSGILQGRISLHKWSFIRRFHWDGHHVTAITFLEHFVLLKKKSYPLWNLKVGSRMELNYSYTRHPFLLVQFFEENGK